MDEWDEMNEDMDEAFREITVLPGCFWVMVAWVCVVILMGLGFVGLWVLG